MSLPRLFLAALLIAPATTAHAADPLAPQDFSALHTLIKPQVDEWRWANIPWETSLWEARQKAAAQGKPLLLWEMDGNPLGCT